MNRGWCTGFGQAASQAFRHAVPHLRMTVKAATALELMRSTVRWQRDEPLPYINMHTFLHRARHNVLQHERGHTSNCTCAAIIGTHEGSLVASTPGAAALQAASAQQPAAAGGMPSFARCHARTMPPLPARRNNWRSEIGDWILQPHSQ